MPRSFSVPSDPHITKTMSHKSAAGPLLFFGGEKTSLISYLIKTTTEKKGVQKS